MIVRVLPEKPVPFIPGQFCTLAIDGFARPYSMSSPPQEHALELFLERVSGGEMTNRLWRLREGDTLKVMPRAKGRFFFESEVRNHLMVCTVTGVAPFMSMIREKNLSGTLDSFNVKVFQGASYLDEFGYYEELADLAHRGKLSYIAAVTRPGQERNAGWTGRNGKIHELFEDFLRTSPPPLHETVVYACGHPGMVKEVAKLSRSLGYRFKEEKYFVLPSSEA